MRYEEVSEDFYAERFLAAAKVTEDADSVELIGPCPGCGHVMTFLITEYAAHRHWFGFRFQQLLNPGPDPEPVPMLCTCEEDHPGRPAEGVGCGAYWNVRLGR